METIIRCDEVKVINEGERMRIKLIILGANEKDIQEAAAEVERKKYYEINGFTEAYMGLITYGEF